MSTPINFSNLWPGLSDQKCHLWKKYDAQSLRNKMMKDKIGKKNKSHKKTQNKKKQLKEWWLKLKQKINQRTTINC